MSLSELEGSLGVVAGTSIGRALFDFFSITDGHWCGNVGGGGIGERVGREGGAGASAGR